MYFQGHRSVGEYINVVQSLPPEQQKKEYRDMRNMVLFIVFMMFGVVPVLAWFASK